MNKATYSFDKFCQEIKWNYVKSANVKKITPNGFNDIEGYRFIVVVRIELKDNKVFKRTGKKARYYYLNINSTYLGDDLPTFAKTHIQNYLNNCLL
jgi:hypothetical protein